MLHGDRAFLERLEDALEVVGDAAHDEAVEQGDAVAAAGTGEDAAPGQEAEVLQQLEEARLPVLVRGLLGSRDRASHAPPGVADVGFADGAVARPPDVAGDLHGEGVGRGHRAERRERT